MPKRILIQSTYKDYAWNIEESLKSGGFTNVEYCGFGESIPSADSVDLVFMVFDAPFKDYDEKYYEGGKPSWRPDIVEDEVMMEIKQATNKCVNAKIALVDIVFAYLNEATDILLNAIAHDDEELLEEVGEIRREGKKMQEFWKNLRPRLAQNIPSIINQPLSLCNKPGVNKDEIIKIATKGMTC